MLGIEIPRKMGGFLIENCLTILLKKIDWLIRERPSDSHLGPDIQGKSLELLSISNIPKHLHLHHMAFSNKQEPPAAQALKRTDPDQLNGTKAMHVKKISRKPFWAEKRKSEAEKLKRSTRLRHVIHEFLDDQGFQVMWLSSEFVTDLDGLE